MTNLLPALEQYFGFQNFREGQQEVVEKILAGQSALAIFPTGSGKSLCYQFSATQLPYLTLVVSPLIALIQDQLAFLRAKNIPAASLDSTLSFEQYRQVVQDVKDNKLKILMVSVERFKNERFRQLLEGINISLLVVDEAHCISEWGHNFRPDYLKLPSFQRTFDIPQALLLTATATKPVKQDMAAKFQLASDAIVQTGFYRSNLYLNVLSVAERDKNQKLLEVLAAHSGQGGIVYVTLQQSAEQVAQYLQQQGINARAYHAGMKNEDRADVQQGFMAGTISVVVATIAFGMGVDKPDIRFVVHYDLPKSIENYSQEIGRAGRDGEASSCYVLGNLNSLNTIENFVYGDTPEQSAIACVLDDIKNSAQGNQWEMSLNQLSNASNIRQLTLKTLLVQLEMRGVITPLYSYSAEYSVKLLCDQSEICAAFDGERRVFVEAILNNIRFRRTWGVVDFDAIFKQVANGERKRIITALEYFKDKGWLELKPSASLEVFEVNPAAFANDLAAQLAQHFKQHEQSEIKRIELMLRFLQSSHCLSYGLAKYFDGHNAPEQCGHCSVCAGQIAKFDADNLIAADEEQLRAAASEFVNHLQESGESPPSRDLITRFLIGISVPILTRTKAKKLAGFGIAQTMRYGDVYKFSQAAPRTPLESP